MRGYHQWRTAGKAIQEFNDRFRKGDATVPGTFVLTNAAQALLDETGESEKALAAVVQNFDDFTEENDPYGEHDFGKKDKQAMKIVWTRLQSGC